MSKGPVLRLLAVVSLLGGLLVGMAPSAHAAYFWKTCSTPWLRSGSVGS